MTHGEINSDMIYSRVQEDDSMYWSLLLPHMDNFPVAAATAHITIVYSMRFEVHCASPCCHMPCVRDHLPRRHHVPCMSECSVSLCMHNMMSVGGCQGDIHEQWDQFWQAKTRLAMLATQRDMTVAFTSEVGLSQFTLYRECELYSVIMQMRAALLGVPGVVTGEYDLDFTPHVSWLQVDGTRFEG
jgi:hypothetical protein